MTAEDTVSVCIEIVNKRGLHARASAKFCAVAGSFDADVQVEKDGMTVGGTSIMGLMMLGAGPGCKINLSATGEQAEEVIDTLVQLIGFRFGEDD